MRSPNSAEMPKGVPRGVARVMPWVVPWVRPWWVPIALAVGSVGVALLLTGAMGLNVVGGVSPLFFAAIALSGYVCGWRAALTATLLSTVATAFYLQYPHTTLNLDVDDAVRLVAFLAVALVISSLQRANQLALRSVEAARAEAEHSRQEAESANLAKDRFLNILGHELRNPLSPILAVTALRLQDLQRPDPNEPGEPIDPSAAGRWPEDLTPDDLREDFEMIQRNIEVEARLIDDLLDSRRIHSGKLRLLQQREDVAALLTESVEGQRSQVEARGLALELRLPSASTPALARRPIIDGDATRLRQVFWNLLTNAAKFTRSGRIVVSLRPSRGGREAVISVADTGIGICPVAAGAIFRPFVQAPMTPLLAAAGEQPHQPHHPHHREILSGLGLGLSIVSALVTAHGGSVRVRSKEGKGSVFRVRLPARWQAVAASQPASYAGVAPVDAAKLRILVVDDHAETARLTARLLMRAGHEVASAHSMSEALDVAAERRFDLLVSDIALGDGTGHDLMRRLVREQNLSGIAVSGFGTPADLAECLAAGFATCLVKPVPLEQLLEQIERLRRERAAA